MALLFNVLLLIQLPKLASFCAADALSETLILIPKALNEC